MREADVCGQVDLYCITVEGESTKLSRVARWNHNYYVTSLVVNKDRIIIGDAVSSVSVLKVEGQELKTVARDYAPLWPLAIEATRDEGVIGSNVRHFPLPSNHHQNPLTDTLPSSTATSSHSASKKPKAANASNETGTTTSARPSPGSSPAG